MKKLQSYRVSPHLDLVNYMKKLQSYRVSPHLDLVNYCISCYILHHSSM